MSRFVCDICGQDVALHEGILTWARDDETLANFKLSHRKETGLGCQPVENNRHKDLYTLAVVSGYMEFIKYLIERWENGFILKDANLLERVLEQLNMHIHEKVILLTEDADD